MAVKRKRSNPIFSNKRRKKNFAKAFFGTLGDPIGTIISLIRKQPPSWKRNSGGLNNFDMRTKQAHYRAGRSMPYFPKSPFNVSFSHTSPPVFANRQGNLIDFVTSLVANPTVQNLGKRALVSAGAYAIPKAITWGVSRVRGKPANDNEQ